MEGPADSLNYMIAGYAILFGILLAYLVSLIVRWKNLRRDEASLKDLEDIE